MTDLSDSVFFSSDSLAPLEEDVSLLSRALDQVVQDDQHVRSETMQAVDRIRSLSESVASLRAHLGEQDESTTQMVNRLRAEVCSLPIGPLTTVIRVIAHQANLSAAAEVAHRTRTTRRAGLPNGLHEVIHNLRSSDTASTEQIMRTLSRAQCTVIFAQHPLSQVNRRTVSRKHTNIASILEELDRGALTQSEEDTLHTQLLSEVHALWSTAELRSAAPTPLDEARGILHTVTNSLWPAIPEFYEQIASALKHNCSGQSVPIECAPMKFHSLLGADKEYLVEGHIHHNGCSPTSTVTEKVTLLNRYQAMGLYLGEIDKLRMELSMTRCSEELSTRAQEIEEDLKASEGPFAAEQLTSDDVAVNLQRSASAESFGSSGAGDVPNHSPTQQPQQQQQQPMARKSESAMSLDHLLHPRKTSIEGASPYRLVLGHLRQLCVNTRRRMAALLADTAPPLDEEILVSDEDLIEPLMLCHRSLNEVGSGLIANGQLLSTIRRAQTFGISLLRLDVRQEAWKQRLLIKAIFDKIGDKRDPLSLDTLSQELRSKRPLVPQKLKLQDTTLQEAWATFAVIPNCPHSSLGTFIISGAESASDVLVALLLQREAFRQKGQPLEDTLPIVPTFETKFALQNAASIAQSLFSNNYYVEHLQAHHANTQEVLLGYGDSAKEMGKLASAIALYTAQEQLLQVSKEAGVLISFSHGRGAAVGRGGSPTHAAVLAQPPGSVPYQMRSLEQGEMVSSKYGSSGLSARQCELYTSAIIRASLAEKSPEQSNHNPELLKLLFNEALSAYNDFLEYPFMQYFVRCTPASELSLSRSSYAAPFNDETDLAHIENVRWSAAFTQSRLLVPAWLGVGTSLKKAIDNGYLQELREQYNAGGLLSSSLDMVEMALLKADTLLSQDFETQLLTDTEQKQLNPVGEKLREEHARAVQCILLITQHETLLGKYSTLRRLIASRQPAMQVLTLCEVESLRRFRRDQTVDASKALLFSLRGIASGSRNTG